MSNIESHFIQQCVYPDRDSPQWLAFLVLNKKYANLTYWSMDGYHCDALADYTKDLVWRDKEIIQWSTKEKIKEVPDFNYTNTVDIVSIWMEICGETDTTKKTWVNSIKEIIK